MYYITSNKNLCCIVPLQNCKHCNCWSKHWVWVFMCPSGIMLSWSMSLTKEISDMASYQLYAYQEGIHPPSTNLWKKVGDVKALPLPMACTLTQVFNSDDHWCPITCWNLRPFKWVINIYQDLFAFRTYMNTYSTILTIDQVTSLGKIRQSCILLHGTVNLLHI